MKKQVSMLLATTIVLLGVAGCGNSSQKSSSSSSKSSAATSSKSVSSSTSANKMNFDQITNGDYTTLQGNWKEVGYAAKGSDENQLTAGSSDSLTVSADQIKNGDMSVEGNKLTDNNGSHGLKFSTKDNILTVELRDADTASINWTVTFYPKGTFNKFTTDNGSVGNKQNLIVIWTSNNSYEEVFAEDSTSNSSASSSSTSQNSTNKSATSSTKTSSSADIDLTQLTTNNFASLVGTWKNPSDGQTIVVTSKTTTPPAGSSYAASVGAVISGQDQDGYPTVITSGSTQDGYMMGSYGTFNPDVSEGSGLQPISIIPKGVKAGSTDDSDSSKARLIMGGGQSGYQSQAYYKE